MSLKVQVLKNSKLREVPRGAAYADALVTMDLSKEADRKDILEALETDGWVILKNVADISSIDAAQENKYTRAILSSARDGNYESRYRQLITASASANSPIQRPPNWRDLAEYTEPVALSCYHLLGQKNNSWEWRYDLGGRGDELHQIESIHATGSDLVICNGWLARPFPRPKDKTDLFLVNHRWKGFGWGN